MEYAALFVGLDMHRCKSHLHVLISRAYVHRMNLPRPLRLECVLSAKTHFKIWRVNKFFFLLGGSAPFLLVISSGHRHRFEQRHPCRSTDRLSLSGTMRNIWYTNVWRLYK